MNTICAITDKGKVFLNNENISSPKNNQVLLEAEYSSLSPGTEHTLMSGHILPLPQYIGYSMAATVIDIGSNVTKFKKGDKVVTTGKHASHLLMDENNITLAPNDIDMEQASFFNLAHTGMYAIRRTAVQLGESTLIMGQGLVGSLTAQLVKLAGGLPVIVTDLDENRLKISKKMGVHYAINTQKNPNELTELVKSLNKGGIPVIFEATGAKQPLEEAFELVSERGRVVMMSQTHGKSLPKYDQNLMMKGATLIGGYINSKPFSLQRTDLKIEKTWPPFASKTFTSYTNSDIWTSDEDIKVFLNLIKYKSIDLKPLITHKFNMDEIPKAYELVWNNDKSLLGGVIKWK
jgi:2-desacetyl-2-hydroxyethyl bacteriochlorophyllide A dehydrogenase